MSAVPQPVPKWDVDQVAAFITSIGLPQLTDAFKANAVAGSDLVALSDEDFKESLGCTPLQMKKIRRELETYGIRAPAATPPATAPAAAPSTPAPAGAGADVGALQGELKEMKISAPAAVAAAAGASAVAGSERASVLQTEVQTLQTRVQAVQGHSQQYLQGQQYLRQAETMLRTAAGALTVTQVSGVTEMLHDRRRGVLGGRPGVGHGPLDRRNDAAHTVLEGATIAKANGQIKQAAQQIEAARQVLPNLPFIEAASVKQATSGVFLNMFFSGLGGDLLQAHKVSKARGSVEKMAQEVHQALNWCAQNATAAQTEAATLSGQLTAKQAELAALR